MVANGSYVNSRDKYERTPLILVSLYLTGADNWYNRERFARLMLERKADPNLSDCYGLTPLIHAAINGQSDYVKVLLSDVSVGLDEPELRIDRQEIAPFLSSFRRSALHYLMTV